jgi:hypothetical protein
MGHRAIVTIVTRNYLAYARALMRHCELHEPGADRFVVIVDRLPAGEVADVPNSDIIYGDELGIERWPRYAFQYTPFELVCALKPHVVDRLIRDKGYQQVVYLDGDMKLYGPLTPVWRALEKDSIVLTPHLLRPLPDNSVQPYESLYSACGTFNAGFFAVRDTDTGRSFTNWWAAMLRKHCIVDLSAGMFVDQRWLCLVPGLFPETCILRHPGLNAGHWTLLQATWECRSTGAASTSDVYVDGDPTVLFHFSGMMPDHPDAYRACQNRISIDEIPCLKRLVDDFHRDVYAAGHRQCVAWGFGMERLSDGTPVKHAWREAIRRDEIEFADVEDPFDVATQPDLLSRYRAVESVAHTWRQEWLKDWDGRLRLSARLRRLLHRVSVVARASIRRPGDHADES